MVLKLYSATYSPQCRAVQMVAAALAIKYRYLEIDITQQEHLSPEFVQLNPQHTVPTLVDEHGFIVWDSHVIMSYLVAKYALNDTLYPKIPHKRAIVDQRLHFENGYLWPRILLIHEARYARGPHPVDESEKIFIEEIYSHLDKFLSNGAWIACDTLTIADFSLFTSVQSAQIILPIDVMKFPNLIKWMERIEKLPVNEINKTGEKEYRRLFKSLFFR